MQIEKVEFHSSACFGWCPDFHFDIDTARQYRLYNETIFVPPTENAEFILDSEKMGYFVGHVSDSLYSELEKELRVVGLDTLTFNGVECCDLPVVTIVVYYDGKRKVLKSNQPPEGALQLVLICQKIWETTPTVRTTETLSFEEGG
jgi:hypothetical protein